MKLFIKHTKYRFICLLTKFKMIQIMIVIYYIYSALLQFLLFAIETVVIPNLSNVIISKYLYIPTHYVKAG